MMGWYGRGMGPLGWLGMGLFWLILLGLIVWLVIRLLPGSNGGTTRDTGRSALEILDRRLASGEIDLITCKPNEPLFWAPLSTGGDHCESPPVPEQSAIATDGPPPA